MKTLLLLALLVPAHGFAQELTLSNHAEAQPAEDSFSAGRWDLELSGSYINHIRFSEDYFYNLTLGGGYYVFDGFSVSGELQGYYADQPDAGEDAALGGVGFLLRWHALRFDRDAASIFFDTGGGITMADREVPEFGTHFNFTAKGGVGATIRLKDNVHLIGGARYFHLSNGNIHGREQNPSYDGIQFWGGLMFTF